MRLLSLIGDIADHRNVAESTLNNYRRAVRYFQNFIGHDAELRDLNELRVSQWLRKAEEKYPANYVRNLRRDLLVCWRFAADRESIAYPRNRLIRLPRKEQREIVAWPLAWIPRLLDACGDLHGYLRTIDVTRKLYAAAYFRT